MLMTTRSNRSAGVILAQSFTFRLVPSIRIHSLRSLLHAHVHNHVGVRSHAREHLGVIFVPEVGTFTFQIADSAEGSGTPFWTGLELVAVVLERAGFGGSAVYGAEIVDDAVPFIAVFELEYWILCAI
jgi:hypothetical protein